MECFIALLIYILSILFNCIVDNLIDKALEEKIKRLGYVWTEEELGEREKNIFDSAEKIRNIIFNAIPVLSTCDVISNYLDFSEFSDREIKSYLENKMIRPIDEIVDEKDSALIDEKIHQVIEFRRNLNLKNRVLAYSDYSVDEKIAFLLRELELAYQEKKELYGGDKTEEENFIKSEQRRKVLGLKKNK